MHRFCLYLTNKNAQILKSLDHQKHGTVSDQWPIKSTVDTVTNNNTIAYIQWMQVHWYFGMFLYILIIYLSGNIYQGTASPPAVQKSLKTYLQSWINMKHDSLEEQQIGPNSYYSI